MSATLINGQAFGDVSLASARPLHRSRRSCRRLVPHRPRRPDPRPHRTRDLASRLQLLACQLSSPLDPRPTIRIPAYSCSSRCVSRPAFLGSDLHSLEVSALAELEPSHFQTKQLGFSPRQEVSRDMPCEQSRRTSRSLKQVLWELIKIIKPEAVHQLNCRKAAVEIREDRGIKH
ncbi:hypothetical protein MLD38_030924 [Melastoma candidum]|uniref:Uncharacterized protein n=1 Tax=Melastoma candidum TaxID=119954 RepID=A0ACB9MQ92_9MYRT|nr:hypothetical protein MLD38_030924 [Melastoma candidum]